jgi:allophanate hydrolase subunit 2
MVSMALGNALVGNDLWATAIELGMASLDADVAQEGWMCLVGRGHRAALDGRELDLGRAVWAREGARLTIQANGRGCWAYLTGPGGWSPGATLVAGGQAQAAVRLPVGALRDLGCYEAPLPKKGLAASGLDRGWRDLTVSPTMSREGIRLLGAGSHGRGGQSSRPVTVGTIQKTPDGTLIVVGPAGPTLGGYEVAGTICLACLSDLSQTPPGATLEIEAVELEEAWRSTTAWWKSLLKEHGRLMNLSLRG